MPTTSRPAPPRREVSIPVPHPTSSTRPAPNRASTPRYPASWSAISESGVEPSIGRSPVRFTALLFGCGGRVGGGGGGGGGGGFGGSRSPKGGGFTLPAAPGEDRMVRGTAGLAAPSEISKLGDL